MPEPTITVALLTHAGGAHVDAYLQALAQSPDCRAVELVDPDARWDEPAQKILGAKLKHVSRDYREALTNRRPDLALITLEARLAPPVIDAALDAGCHVFAEKPACVRVEDFAPLVRKADSRHLNLMLALANRTNPEILSAKQLIESGRIGRLFGLEAHIIADQTRLKNENYWPQWFAHKDRAGGGHLIWLGIHWLDLAMYITNSAISQVAGFTTNIGKQPIEVEDSAVAAFKFENGALGTMTSGYYLDKGYHSHIKVWGSAGWIHLEPEHDLPLHWYTTLGEQAGQVQIGTESKQPRGYTPFVKAAIQACARGTAPPISNAESLRALKTVFAIYAAAESETSTTILPRQEPRR
jgi:predicted dehydrogenase